MNNITIPIHSLIDNITNSSTVTYMYANDNAVQIAKDMLKDIMETLGVQGEVEDFYNVELVPDPDWAEDIRDCDEDDYDSIEEMEEFIAKGRDDEGYCKLMVTITPKNDPSKDIVSYFTSMINVDSYYS